MSQELHERYVPILHFARGERFFPMSADAFLRYSTLRLKGESAPLVRQGLVTSEVLAGALEQPIDVYLQSVPSALADQDIAAGWGRDVLQTLADATYRTTHWQAELAGAAYRWLSPKTQAATRLFWWNDLIMPLLAEGRRSKADLPRLSLPPEISQAAADNYAHSEQEAPGFAYYYRVTQDANYACLQYWLFYGFNDWATRFEGMNDHEGDWEGLYLFFDLDKGGQIQEPPAYITYVGHHSRLTKPWGHPEVVREGSHPVAYVAGGSHATYPQPKRYELMATYGLFDYATGDGLCLRPEHWGQRLNLDDQPWALPFVGTWGTRYWPGASWAQRLLSSAQRKLEQYGLPGVSGPRGPRYTDEGRVRPNWSSVVDWAGIFDLQQTRRAP